MSESNMIFGCVISAIGIFIYMEMRFKAYDDDLNNLKDKLEALERDNDGLWC